VTQRSFFILFLSILTLTPQLGCAFGRKPEKAPEAPAPIVAPSPAPVTGEPGGDTTVVGAEHRARYPLTSATQKLIDNQGNGFEPLYGLRNVRAVLNGVYYRGGANNSYNKHKKRSNANPLPEEGLQHMCEEGFGHAVYLYDENFSTASKVTRCRTKDGANNTLDYVQIDGLASGYEKTKELHELIYQHIRDPRLGAIYDHCWNGWHASGYVAATTLRQFCGFSAEQAVKYWDVNTDGNNKESGYESIRRKIRGFVPDPNMQLSAAEKAALCPDPGSLAFTR
jgi:hypothetical protein